MTTLTEEWESSASLARGSLPSSVEDVQALETLLSQPRPEVVEALRRLDGDLMILGAGGKMGPTLCLLARRAIEDGGLKKRVLAVSRFSDSKVEKTLADAGVETIACDLMDRDALWALPAIRNIIYMVGHKFGTTGQESKTWAINAFLSGLVAQRFGDARILAFSSGNVYPFTSVVQGHCTEQTSPDPVGEYAQSVLARERIMAYFAQQTGAAVLFLRLNYAVELRYGVLLDIAQKVWTGAPIDLRMGHANVIWQGDANAFALRALHLASSPPSVLNVTGPETLSVRALAVTFGKLLGRTPRLEGIEEPEALLSSAERAFTLLGYPYVPVGKVIEWTADWVSRGKDVYDKPTKFQVRDGHF
ncbi:MAG: NAD-dependent epimerase/dehydratase family protein [Anaerolineae bacterium]